MATYQFNVISLQLKIPESQKYPSANEIGSTGIWDTPYGYSMDGDEDNHPLADHFEKYIPTDTEIGTLVVNVYNVNGNPAAEVGGTTSVELIRSGETSTIAEQTIDAESKATFSNVLAGEYYINVQHDPPVEQGDEEFWGQWTGISIIAGTTTTIDFYGYTPYVEAFYAEKSPVAIDTPAKINVTIKVPSNYTGTEVHVKTSIIIRNGTGHEVYQDMSSSRIVQRGDDTTFSFSYTPTETGVYSGLAKAYVVGSVELCTDNCGWVEVFEVKRRVGLTLYTEDAYGIVNKAPGDLIDIVAQVTNIEDESYDVNVTIEVPSGLIYKECFNRTEFTDIKENPMTCIVPGDNYKGNYSPPLKHYQEALLVL